MRLPLRTVEKPSGTVGTFTGPERVRILNTGAGQCLIAGAPLLAGDELIWQVDPGDQIVFSFDTQSSSLAITFHDRANAQLGNVHLG